MKKELLDYIASLMDKAKSSGLILDDEQEINYGIKLVFTDGKNQLPVNLYHSAKKGVTAVIGGAKNNPLKPKLEQIINLSNHNEEQHDFTTWIGTDESGKGDFFGPLVVTGVILNKSKQKQLAEIGVKDSKLLSDIQIKSLIPQIYRILKGDFETIVLHPLKYNELYEKFRNQGKKLNELLAWMHGRVILNLAKKIKVEAVIVDKFANEKVLKQSLKEINSLNVIQNVRGESDIAVACASILSRYQYLITMESLSKKYQIHLPKGASAKVKKIARTFIEQYSKERLVEIAKIHFKTYNEI